MPDLGKYAFTVLLAYGVTFAFLAALVGFVLWRSAMSKARLKEAERDAD